MLMLICCERKTLLNGWLILADKFKRIGWLINSWAIWHARRKTIHERKLIQETAIAKGFEFKGRNKHQPSPRTHSWKPLEDGCCKLNTDAIVGWAGTQTLKL
jgi:hypothetical protein